MKITAVDSIRVQVPWPADQIRAGVIADVSLTRLRTDEGITGWGFQETGEATLNRIARPLLVGADPFTIEDLVQRGLDRAPGAEHALWDIAGKASGQPVHRMLGQFRDRLPVYLTIVWPGEKSLTPQQRVDDIMRYAGAGFKAVKIRIFNDDPFEDIQVLRGIREQIGGREWMEVMYDRTAQYSGTVWSFDLAVTVARELEKWDASWLEEPLHDRDLMGHARLAEMTSTSITGGERDWGLRPYASYCLERSFDVLQPDVSNCGGISTLKKIASLAEGFRVPTIFHGGNGLGLAASLQVAATVPSCRIHEVVYTTPPLTPQEQWRPLLRLVRTPELYHLEDGILQIPAAPGLGIDLDEAAVEEYQVPAGTPARPGPY